MQHVVQQHACMLNCVFVWAALQQQRFGLASLMRPRVPALRLSLPVHPSSNACCADALNQTTACPKLQEKVSKSCNEGTSCLPWHAPAADQGRGYATSVHCSCSRCSHTVSCLREIKQGCCRAKGASHPCV
jgi:hypothetical protein